MTFVVISFSTAQSTCNRYKKLSYRRKSANLTSLYRTVQKDFDMLNRSKWRASVIVNVEISLNIK